MNSKCQLAVVTYVAIYAVMMAVHADDRVLRQPMEAPSNVNTHNSVQDSRPYPKSSSPWYVPGLHNTKYSVDDMHTGNPNPAFAHRSKRRSYTGSDDKLFKKRNAFQFRRPTHIDLKAFFKTNEDWIKSLYHDTAISDKSRANRLTTLQNLLRNGSDVKGSADSSDILENDEFANLAGDISKRRDYNCDVTKVTLNTIMEYLRTGKVCGYRAANVRFGLGR